MTRSPSSRRRRSTREDRFGRLTNILTYHMVPGRVNPQNVDGVHKTLQGADLTVTGFGNNLRVNKASVVCGGVQTANATVYLIDTVLTSPAM